MNNKLKKAVIFLGLGTFALGIATSLSSFGTIASSTSTPLSTCYTNQNVPDCPPNTNFTLTINGTSSDSYTITSGSTPGTWTIGVAGQSLSFPKKTGTSSTTETGTNGSSYTLAQTVTSTYEIYCNLNTSPGGQACGRVDCLNHLLQTYSCATPGPGTGTGTPNSAIVW